MKTLFDKQITLKMGQCNVKRWVDDLLPLAEDLSFQPPQARGSFRALHVFGSGIGHGVLPGG